MQVRQLALLNDSDFLELRRYLLHTIRKKTYWEEFVDPTSGNIYYVNKESGESVWKWNLPHPPFPAGTVHKKSKASDHVRKT